MKVQPTTKELIAMLYERLPELFDRAQPAPVQELVYQMQRADGSWIDQDKQAFEYNSTHGWPVRTLYTTPPAAQPALKPLTPDMFWDQDDAETPHDSIEEFLNSEICNGYLEVGAVFTLLQAKKFPSVKIRVTSIDENECEAEYEIIEAAHGIKEKNT